MNRPIYLDYNATTPVEKRVLDRMTPFFLTEFGNPSNNAHAYGWAADEACEVAREQLASLIGAGAEEIFFTGGATEAINLAIKGLARRRSSLGRHIITCATEHRAVLSACHSLRGDGFKTTVLPVDGDGTLNPGVVREALTDDTILVAIMWANNETGVVHPVKEISSVLADHQALFLCDATQAVGKLPVDVSGIDLLACSAHKFYGPKGVGALYVRSQRPAIRLFPLIHGGGQEHGLRAGTLNVPGIVGLGAAAEMASECQESDADRLTRLRDHFEDRLAEAIPGLKINGKSAPRLPGTSNITFPDVVAGDMMQGIGRLAASLGSACSAGSGKPSHVLAAMGLTKKDVGGSVRFSMGRHTTNEEIDTAADLILEAMGVSTLAPLHND
jgi:cysteine desulfurase